LLNKRQGIMGEYTSQPKRESIEKLIQIAAKTVVSGWMTQT